MKIKKEIKGRIKTKQMEKKTSNKEVNIKETSVGRNQEEGEMNVLFNNSDLEVFLNFNGLYVYVCNRLQ